MRNLNPWPNFPSHLERRIARSLSLQFILQGLLDAFEAWKSLQNLRPPKKEVIPHICKELEQFLLLSLKNPFTQKGSALDKLCFYSEILLKTSHIEKSEFLAILEEMRHSILKVKAKMISWEKTKIAFASIRQPLSQLCENLYQGLCQCFAALVPFLQEACCDENVLAYLLENKDRFNAYLGPRRMEALLQSFFPAGQAQLRSVIYEGYSRRGFSSFLSSLDPLIDAIEWEKPCPSPKRQ